MSLLPHNGAMMTPAEPVRRRPSTLVLVIAAVAVGLGVLIMLYPVLLSPVNADDRYWYVEVLGRTQGSYANATAWTFEDLQADAENGGRVTVLAFLVRRLSMIGLVDAAVLTSTPIVAMQGVLKLGLVVATVLACWSFLRVLRYRASGQLHRLRSGTIAVATLSTAVLISTGAQAHSQVRNGWTSYAILTYSAAVVMVAAVALIVWLTRRAATAGPSALVVGVIIAALLGLVLNTSYELYYVTVPLVLAAVIQQPMSAEPNDPRARRAKLAIGGSFTVSFLVFFALTQAWVSRLCRNSSCYEGAQMDLSTKTLVTATRNLLTAVPGGGRSELLDDLERVGMESQLPSFFTPGSLLVSLLVGLGLAILLRRIRARETDTTVEVRAHEVRLLLLAALIPAAAAVGTALIMALSGASHELITAVGLPYRNTMVTWSMLALTGSMLLTAGALLHPRSVVWVVALITAVTLLGGHTLAHNYPALRAHRAQPGLDAVADVHWEVVLGDLSEKGDARRCQTLRRLGQDMVEVRPRERLAEGAQRSFQHYHQRPYCSDPPKRRG